jgi:ABC-2 type transport system ATP-binding protein
MPSIEAKGLTKSFGSSVGSNPNLALDHVSFRFDRKGAVGYLGPNGSGKTTTLKLFTGLLRATEGSATVNDIDIAVDPKKALACTGALIETPEPYPQFTVEESLQLVADYRGIPPVEAKSRIRTLRDSMDLPPLTARTGKLSKGQRQRVVLAGTLLAEPDVLLLDEPTSGLDPAERVTIRKILMDIKKDCLVFMSSHLLEEVTEICDDVIFLSNGLVVLKDSVDHLSERFKTTSLDVEFSTPIDNSKLLSLNPLTKGVEVLSDRRLRIMFDGTDNSRSAILSACQTLGQVSSFSNSVLTLESAYIELMKSGTRS